MFNNQTRILDCDLCGHGAMIYNEQATIDAYVELYISKTEKLYKIVDDNLNKYLIFSCYSCGNQKRYTYKEVEKLLRKDITKRIMDNIQTEQFLKILPELGERRYMRYCGKCTGFDGNGSCPPKIYDECEIKRFSDAV